MRLSTRILAVLSAPALAVSVVVAAPQASAGSSDTQQPISRAELLQSSLSVSDVPRWMRDGEEPSLERAFAKRPDARGPDVCLDQNGEDVTGPAPRMAASSMVTTRQNLDDFQFIEVNSNIYQYRDRAAAERAWHSLQSTVHGCAGTIEIDVEEEGASVSARVATSVSTTGRQFGYRGFALLQDVALDISAGEIEIDILGDQYASYRLAGTTVLRVEIAVINGNRAGTIGHISQSFVDTMARVVALRVERRSLR